MTDRNRTLVAIAIGALIVVGLVAGFSIAENGWGGDDDGDESGAVTYCVETVVDGAPTQVAADIQVVDDAADEDDTAADTAVLQAARRAASDAESRCGVAVTIPQI
jgi:hypothetical protein